MDELRRFTSLFDQLVEHTFSYLARIDDLASYATVPIDSDVNFLGTRVNRIHIGSLLRHYVVAEAHWFAQLARAEDGAIIPFPDNAAILEGIEDGEPLLHAYRTIYLRAKQDLASIGGDDLNKRIRFAGRNYTVMGMLWTILSHHSFHLGQIDLLMRQQNIQPPEYMEWPEREAVIG